MLFRSMRSSTHHSTFILRKVTFSSLKNNILTHYISSSSSMLDGITRLYERFCILDGDADGSEFFKRLLTLAMVHVASTGSLNETVSFFEESVAPFLESHCRSATYGTKGESLSIYCHVVEAVATAIETDFPTPQLLDRVLPFVFDSLAPYESSPLGTCALKNLP